MAAKTQDADDVTDKEELRLKTQERLRKEKTGQGERGGVPIAMAVGEVTSSSPLQPSKKMRKPRASKAEMEARAAAEQAPDLLQSTMDPFLTPRLATPTGISVSRSPKAVSLQNMVSAFRQSPK